MRYGALRLRWCGLALRAFVARWGVLLLVTALVAGAGSNGPVAAVAALAGWLVLPLAVAATHGAWLLPAWLAQAVVGAALVWGARAMLWPAAWRDAERALPVPRADTLRSDALVVALTLLPLWVLQAAGAAALLASRAPWLQGSRALAMVALATAALGSLGLGVALLQRLRRGPLVTWPVRGVGHGRGQRGQAGARPRSAAEAATALRAPAACVARPGPWPRPAAAPFIVQLHALLWLPLWRGPAQRTGQTLLLAAAALCVPAAGLLWRPGAAGWWLAAWSLAALLATTRLATLARLEFTALHAACAALPIAPQRLRHARLALPLLALVPGLLLVALALLPASGLRPVVLAAWALACLAGCIVEAWSAPADPASKASRWLFTLALCVALGSEVLR